MLMKGIVGFLGMIVAAGFALAEDIVFPSDAGVIDVTKPPYSAKGDGKTDDTAPLRQALMENGAANRIIYLPNGVYLISDTLDWPSTASDMTRERNTILQGQSREGTILRIMDYSSGYRSAGKPQPMLWTGDSPGDRTRNSIRNLTLHTGVGNPGAIGIQFDSNQQGGIRDVTIMADGKGDGPTGLDLSHSDLIGPAFFKNLRIDGFQVGIRMSYSSYSMTFENIELANQKIVGIRNSGQCVQIRKLRSTNSVSTIQNSDAAGFIVLLDSILTGLDSRRPPSAIVNRGLLFVRGVKSSGYSNVIENRQGNEQMVSGDEVALYTSHDPVSLFPATPQPLNLPVQETPEIPWDPTNQWAGPLKFGGQAGPGADASDAIQKAIDSGATTVYLPNGDWVLRKTVLLRGRVRRLIGCEARVRIEGPRDQPGFRLVEGESPAVIIERIECAEPANRFVEQASRRSLILSSCYGVSGALTGPGDLFIEDVSGLGPWNIGGQRVWARQWCLENNGAKIINDSGLVWLFGLKTEKAGTVVKTTHGGRTELLGGLVVSSGGWKSEPMFTVEDSAVSLVAGESSMNGAPYLNIVSETRHNKTKVLTNKGLSEDRKLPARLGGVALPLYVGIDPALPPIK
jgi:hypothetical protein